MLLAEKFGRHPERSERVMLQSLRIQIKVNQVN